MSNIANDNVVVQGNFSSKKSSNGGSNSGGGDMDRIEITLAKIEGELKTKASAVDLAEVKGKISQIPNTWQMITMILGSQITLFGLFFALMKFGIK
jgi:hypothetical protein